MLPGFYEALREELIRSVQIDSTSPITIISIYGSSLSGKKTICREFLSDSAGYSIKSLPTLAIEGKSVFIEELLGCVRTLLTGFDDLEIEFQEILADLVVSRRLGIFDSSNLLWMITSNKPLDWADIELGIPHLSSDPLTHASTISMLLGSFPLHPECPMTRITPQATLGLSLGELAKVINTSKTLALSMDEALCCRHLLESLNSFSLPVGRVSITADQVGDSHDCAFIVTVPQKGSLEAFIGLPEATMDIIHDFRETRSSILLISGPVGSGKTHLAYSIANNPGQPTVRLTTADILRSKIGDTEKMLHKAFNENDRLIIEDLDKLVPVDASDCTGSVQRCLPVLVAFLDRLRPGAKTIIATTRDRVHPRVEKKLTQIHLSNSLRFEDKVALIKTQYDAFDSSGVTPFDLINLSNRSACIDYGRELNMKEFRAALEKSSSESNS
jgi:hypothetical protein